MIKVKVGGDVFRTRITRRPFPEVGGNVPVVDALRARLTLALVGKK